MQCPSCQTPVDASQRFCPKCGTMITQPSAPDPLIGTTIGGKYRIIKLLGEGGMGCVYEGEQTLGTKARRVAIKTLHPHLSKDPKVIARFQREVGTIAELEHPNTIQVYDFGSTQPSDNDGGQLYIVMEFVQGKSLAEVLEKGGALEPQRAEHILGQICGSLAEAHARGIIHRDMKPDNVVLTERAGQHDFVKVLDFGIAKRGGEEDKNEQKLTQQGMVLGTPPYMSPEQFTGKPIDARSDVYAVGVMAYEMLTGQLPFKAESAWEWATQHMTVPPMAIESTPNGARIPDRMKIAIMRALAKNPDQRWGSVNDFFNAFASGAPAMSGSRGTAPAFAMAAPEAAGAPVRQKTEVGAPIDPAMLGATGGGAPAGAYGPPPSPMGANPPAQAYVPPGPGAAGYATPGGIPQAPSREQGGGGGRTLLMVLAGVIGVGSIVAIVFALKGSGGSSKTVDFGGITTGPSTTAPAETSTSTAGGDTPAPPDTGSGGLEPLGGGKTKPPKPEPNPHPAPGPGPKPSPGPSPAPSTGPGPSPTPTPTPTPTTPPPPPPREPAACAAARQMKAIGKMNEYNTLAAACRAQGGTP